MDFHPWPSGNFFYDGLFPKNDGRRAHAQKKSQAQKAQQEISGSQLSSHFSRHSQEFLQKECFL